MKIQCSNPEALSWLCSYLHLAAPPENIQPVVQTLIEQFISELNWTTVFDTLPVQAFDTSSACPTCGQLTVFEISEQKCQLCNSQLVFRHNKKTGSVFLGCPGFPNCRYTKTISSAVREYYEEMKKRKRLASSDSRLINVDV